MPRTVISASRRTDIPAFYMPWFMASIEKKHFEVVNPYNRSVSRVPAGPDQVHSIVFWSKDFGPFIRNGYGEQLRRMGFRLFFNFTINSRQRKLEPSVPPLEQRLKQLTTLSRTYGPACINWRFDPICIFNTAAGQTGDNLDGFDEIAGRAAGAGIKTCITSFVDHYRKVQRRCLGHSDLQFVEPSLKRKIDIVGQLVGSLESKGIDLQLCCEKELLEALPSETRVSAAACISSRRLAALYGPDLSLARDSSQRRTAGCMCGASRDIGSYSLHPCHHNCLFCYANPAMDHRSPQTAGPDGASAG